jgi:hypothetical protein
MTSNPKSTNEAAPESAPRENPPAADTNPYTAFAALVHKGVERLAEMQKVSLDMATRHTSEAIGTCRQSFKVPADTPGIFLMDLADQGIQKMAQAQKGMIDLVVQQSAHNLEMAKERRDLASKWTNGVSGMVSATADRVIAAQEIALDFAAEQNKVVANAVKGQAGFAGSAPAAAAVDTIQRNVDVVIQTQKEMVQSAAKPLKSAATASAA